ncbi:MAG: hypothetical protein WAS55_08450 [Saprospiraceae bacterium]
MMKSIIFLFAIALFCYSACSPSFWDPNKKLNFILTSPTKSNNMAYNDSIIDAEFWFTRSSLEFSIKNKTKSTLKVIWDEAAFVQFGESQRIMHLGTKYIDRSQNQPASSIPPGASITDQVTPTNNVSFDSGKYGSGWKTKDIFELMDGMGNDYRENKGKYDNTEIGFYLPIETKGNRLEYNFTFWVTEIKK